MPIRIFKRPPPLLFTQSGFSLGEVPITSDRKRVTILEMNLELVREFDPIPGHWRRDFQIELVPFCDFLLFEDPDAVLGRGLFVVFIHLLPLLTLASIVLIFFGWSWLFALGFVLVQGIVNWIYRKEEDFYSIFKEKTPTPKTKTKRDIKHKSKNEGGIRS